MSTRRHKWHPICEPPRNLVRPVAVDPTGATGPTKAQATGPRWRRTTRSFYVRADVSDDLPEQRILEQSMRLPRGGAVTGWASCRVWGGSFFDGLDIDGVTRFPVPLAVGDFAQLTETSGSTVSRDRLDPDEVSTRAGVACTTKLRALFDAARWACDVREAVVAIDMMAAADLVSLKQLSDYTGGRAGWRGVGQVREALSLASEHSRSPNETRMRLIWELDAGLPRPLVNRPVFDLRGRLVGIADLLDPVAGVVGEFDGADHRSGRRQAKDVAREDGFRGLGLEYFKVTGPDMASRMLVANRMTNTLLRATLLPRDKRQWTIAPPDWWEEELPLNDRLELHEWQLSLYRQYEREGFPKLPNVS